MGFWSGKKEGETENDGTLRPESERVDAVTRAGTTSPPPAPGSPTPAVLGANDSARTQAVQSSYQLEPSKIRCALGTGTSINGKLSFDTSVQLDGKMKGELYCSKSLIVGSTGVVEAKLDVASLVVSGVVKGTVRVTEKLELKAGGLIEGEIETPCFVMEEGARFLGNIRMLHVGTGLVSRPPQDIKQASASTDKETADKASRGEKRESDKISPAGSAHP